MGTRKRTRIKLNDLTVRRRPLRNGVENLEPTQEGESGHDDGVGEGNPAASVPGNVSSAASDVLAEDIDENLAYLTKIFGQAPDIVVRQFCLVDGNRAAILYVDGLSNTQEIEKAILEPLVQANLHGQRWLMAHRSTEVVDDAHTRSLRHLPAISVEDLQRTFSTIAHQKVLAKRSAVLSAILEDTLVVLLVDGQDSALAMDAIGGKDRAIEEPSTEAVIRGPREGFNENAGTGLSLIRRRLRTPDLKVEPFTVGAYTNTKILMCYIAGVADDATVEELRRRIERIETDSVVDSGYIEEFIEDNPRSPFPQVQNTERPDVAVAMLLEGRMTILVDGSPFALIVPVNLWGALQAAEDYYERHLIANAIRWLRYIFLLVSLYLPSMYVAITTFHQELLPQKLLMSIAAAREVTPFPAIVEALIMEITFEALREAGIRLPKTIGSAISIVGALVIGQAAVQAGIVSAPMVIVVSLTGIASFVIPRFNFAIAIRMLRFPLILLAGTLGLYGVVIGTLAVLIHLTGLRSLGMPYLSPITPFSGSNMKDVFVRAPWWRMKSRPVQTSKANLDRQTDATRPENRIPTRQRPQA